MYCTCGGYAWSMNGRDPEQPHMEWCPKFDEHATWVKAGGLQNGGRRQSQNAIAGGADLAAGTSADVARDR